MNMLPEPGTSAAGHIVRKVSGLVLLLLLLTALVFTGCDNGGGGTYRVSYILDGTSYELTGGYTATNVFTSNANGAKGSSDYLRIGAVDSSVSDMDSEGPYIYIRIGGTTPATYTEADSTIGIVTGDMTDYYDHDGSSLTITLSSCGDVGGAIEGTFSGQVNETTGGPTVALENGYFYVERLADESVEVPDYFK
jgi:hypothetical protein